jgi:hypothetical protein
MSDFEFIFALFGLLLGLSITEVLGGMARVIENRLDPSANVRIGWLTPLLASFVLLDLLSFWKAAWMMRSRVVVSGESLFAVTVFACSYYVAAHMVFPRTLPPHGDIDDHFFRVRRVVIGILLATLLCQIGWYATIPAMQVQLIKPYTLGMTVLLGLLMVAAMVVRRGRWASVVMLALVGRYVIGYLL